MVEEIDGLERIRFMTSHPKDLSDELIEVMKNSKKICRHLHLPLQSGSSRVLKEMNRHYDKEHYLALVEKIKKAMPDLAITTDIIVGFPGETEEDFLETMDVVRQVEYDSAFTFIYSKRTGTPAAKMENQIPEETKKLWQQEVMELQEEIIFEKNEDMVDRELYAFIEGKVADENAYVGRTYRDAPSIDGYIFVNTEETLMTGDFAKVKVTGAYEYDLIGELA